MKEPENDKNRRDGSVESSDLLGMGLCVVDTRPRRRDKTLQPWKFQAAAGQSLARLPCSLILGDCLEVMKGIESGTVDMVCADLPYGTTACKWDAVIPFEPLWEQYRRVCKRNAAIVLTASQPFTSALVMSNVKDFKYCWVWDKENGANFAVAKYQPLKTHEDVCVFSRGRTTYNPQKTMGPKNHGKTPGRVKTGGEFMGRGMVETAANQDGMKFPKSIQRFSKHPSQCGLHPTQKPVALMEYLIKTYTNEGQTVLDNTMGSGTTGVACVNTGRHFIGIERDEEYFRVASERISSANT